MVAVIDTGYEGFALPWGILEAFQFDSLQLEKKRLILANGEILSGEGAYGSFLSPSIAVGGEGLVETYEGLGEVFLGVEALRRTSTLLDYRAKKTRIEKCP